MVGPAFLLDVNVLLALMWPQQEHHSIVEAWFFATGRKHWATCPITEAGCVRLLSNPSVTPGAIRVSEALHVLAQNLKQPGHVFWTDDVDLLAPYRCAEALCRDIGKLRMHTCWGWRCDTKAIWSQWIAELQRWRLWTPGRVSSICLRAHPGGRHGHLIGAGHSGKSREPPGDTISIRWLIRSWLGSIARNDSPMWLGRTT